MGNVISQSFPQAAPTFTLKELPDQSEKVFIVTGGYAGVGFELVKILYQRNGTVYIAGRSQEKGAEAITKIKSEFSTTGKLEFLLLDLGDLTTIKASAEDFLSKSDRLDCLFNNAGVMNPPKGSVTTQGYELQLGTNCLGPYLFTKLLTPMLKKTAASSLTASVRVVWAGSAGIDLAAPKNGMDLDDLWYKKGGMQEYKYAQSKCGNAFIASEYAKVVGGDGVISVCMNPGNLVTSLQRNEPAWRRIIFHWVSYAPIYGAYTELFSGLSPEVTPAHNGDYIVPWGTFHDWPRYRPDIANALRSEAEGGSGKADQFYKWCEEQTANYV